MDIFKNLSFILTFLFKRLFQNCLKLIFSQRRKVATLDFQFFYTLRRSVFA
jgi:hypothetical protein